MSRTAPHLPPLSLEQSVTARFRQVAAAAPDLPAVVDGDRCITYAALDAWSDRIAGAVSAQPGGWAEPVALLCAHGPAALAAMLGVLKAGCIYCVVDPAMPAARLAHIVADLTADLVLADHETMTLAHSLDRPSGRVLEIEALAAALSPLNLPSSPASDDLAAIYYSSGTTGQPKGILRDHAALVHRAWVDAEVVPLGPGDAVAWLYSAAYSASVADIFGALLNGAALHVYHLREQGIGELANWLDSQRITSLHLHANVLHQLLDAVPDDHIFRHLRYVRPSDRLAISDLRRLRRHLPPGAVIAHSLGSSETGPVARFVCRDDTPLEGETTPVGFPLNTVEISLLDEAGKPVAGEGIGEIVVRSRYLARGYWRQPELTAQRFQSDPDDPCVRIYRMGDFARRRPDGMLELVGRSDRRVKIRGYSVDLVTVEAALAAQPGVAEAVVVVQGQSDGDRRLMAYITPTPDSVPSASAVRIALAGQVPHYMLPARIAFVEVMPRQPNGKVDISALPVVGRARPDLAAPFVAPRNELEQQIADIWTELLELDEVGVEDDFFELGGDSILAMRMLLYMEAITGPVSQRRLPPILTVANLASLSAPDISTPKLWQQPADALTPSMPSPRAQGTITLNASLKWAARQMMLAMNYRQSQKWLHWLSSPSIAQRLFRQEAEWLGRLTAEMDHPAPNASDILRTSIIGNMLQSAFRVSQRRRRMAKDGLADMRSAPQRLWRSFADQVAQTSAAERRRLIQFHGLEQLVHAQKQGRGVILVTYHAAPSDLANVALAHITALGRIPTVSLVQADLAARQVAEDEAEVVDSTATWGAFYGLEAHHRLRQGGVVRFASDISYDHPNTIRKQIGARNYQLKPGFAEMALLTDAIVLPIYTHCDPSGAIHLSILPAMQHPDAGIDHHERVLLLLDQYVGFLNATWRAVPASLGWGALRRYYNQPMAVSATPGAALTGTHGVSQ